MLDFPILIVYSDLYVQRGVGIRARGQEEEKKHISLTHVRESDWNPVS